jgi:hypothetical protein
MPINVEDRLAVTAGHCSDAVPDETVYADNGVQIGKVVAWKQDAETAAGKLNGACGCTVILVYEGFSLEPFFTGVRSSTIYGDYVTSSVSAPARPTALSKCSIRPQAAGSGVAVIEHGPAARRPPVARGTRAGTRWLGSVRAAIRNGQTGTRAARHNRSKQCST